MLWVSPMNPRLRTSTKWTALPPELIDQIKSVFLESFKQQLDGSKLFVDGRIYPEEILMKVGFVEPSRLKQDNFHVSIDLDLKKKNNNASILSMVHSCVDAIASIMNDFFESRQLPDEEALDLPYEWMPFEFNKMQIYLRYSTENTELEAQADAILGISKQPDKSKVLVHESEEEQEPTKKKQPNSKKTQLH